MPLALAVIGLVLVLVGIRDTYGDFASALKEEFTGPGNFGFRAAAIVMVGAVGYAGGRWRELSIALMSLLVLGLLLSVDSDFFGQLGKGVSAQPVTPTASPAVTEAKADDDDLGDALKQGAAIIKAALPLAI